MRVDCRASIDDTDRQWFQRHCSPRHSQSHSHDVLRTLNNKKLEEHLDEDGPPTPPWWHRFPHGRDGENASGGLTPGSPRCHGTHTPSGLRRRKETSNGTHMQEQVLQDLLAARRATRDTPADMLLGMLSDMLLGHPPDMDEVALARSMLLRHVDPYQPLPATLRSQMEGANLAADVVHALMHQLGAGGGHGGEGKERHGQGKQEQQQRQQRRSSMAVSGGGEGEGGGGGGEQSLDRSTSDVVGPMVEGDEEVEGAWVAQPQELLPLHEALVLLMAQPQSRTRAATEDGVVQAGSRQRPSDPAGEARGGEWSCSGGSGSGDGSGVDVQAARRPQMTVHAVPPPVIEEVERCLSLVDGWQYDTWRLAEASQGHALSTLCFFLLQREGLTAQFRLPPRRLARLLRTLEEGYAPNPYHNSTHAADVLQTLHVLLRGSGLTTHYLDRLGLLAAYLAATVHDHGHPGLTSDFLVATQDRLALRYNDRSPLENHHGASFFQLLRRPDMDVLGAMGGAERAAFRRQVLDLVLATDMKQHFALLAHFNTAHRLAAYSKEAGPWAGIKREGAEAGGAGGSAEGDEGATVNRTHSVSTQQQQQEQQQQQQEPRPSNETERTLSLQIALKVADLGHLGEELEVHKRWVRCLEEEFFRQGDQERALGLPISPLFDRAKQGVSKSQVGFYDFIALPLVHAFASAFPGARPLLGCFVANYDHWRAVERAGRERERAEAGPAAAATTAQSTPEAKE